MSMIVYVRLESSTVVWYGLELGSKSLGQRPVHATCLGLSIQFPLPTNL